MSHHMLRFYFKTSPATDALSNALQLVKHERSAHDANSISILCHCEDDALDTVKNNWIEAFKRHHIELLESVDHEKLEHDHCCTHHHHHDHGHDHHHDHGHSHENHWLKAGIGLAFGVGMLVLSVVGIAIPFAAYCVITGVSTVISLYLGYGTLKSAWNALKEGKWNMATLYSLSTLVIIITSILGLFIPGLPLMLESAPLILGFWHLGEAIEHLLLDKIQTKMDVRDIAPKKVTLNDTLISVKKLLPNDVITLKKGDVVPVDGIVLGDITLYTTRINGSPFPKRFKKGEMVQSGMVLAENETELQLQVSHTWQNSYLSQIAKNIKKATDEKAPIEEITTKILTYFVPTLLAIALLSGVIVSIFCPPAIAIQCMIAVLVSACPCTLSLITPLAVQMGMKKTAEQGIQYKNGKALQAAARIDHVVFDLNGTLTQGDIQVKALAIEDETLLPAVARLECESQHPSAKAINTYLKKYAVENLEITDLDQSHHSGIQGTVNGMRIMVGNKDLLVSHKIQLPERFADPQKGSVYIVKDGAVVGQILLDDPLRADAKATVKQLQSMGKTVHICTGADKETALRYAQQLGIKEEHIGSNLSGASAPNTISKGQYVNELQKNHSVAMVGDAANDLTALAESDFKIAVRSSIGDTLTEDYADITLQQGLLAPIATAFDVASKTKSNILQNLFISLTYNTTITLIAAGVLIPLGFALHPAIGVALMIVESAIVLANLYRFKEQEPLVLDAAAPVNESTNAMIARLGSEPKHGVVHKPGHSRARSFFIEDKPVEQESRRHSFDGCLQSHARQ